MSGDAGEDIKAAGLDEVAQGITLVLGELKDLGIDSLAGAGRGFSELALSGLELGNEELLSQFTSFCERWEWGVRALVNEGNNFATGGIAWHTRSTLWGTTAWAASSTTYTPLRFPGQYYDPATARYLTSDPLGLAPAPNPAGYVHNPQTWAGPWGLAPCKDAEQNAAARNETVLGKEVPVRDEASVGST